MSHLTGKAHTSYVQGMFARIAGRYDLLNRLMTFGLDIGLRREAIRMLNISPGDTVMDVGCGTGDISLALRRQHPEAAVIGCDLTLEMVLIARRRSVGKNINYVIADAEALPFAPRMFNGLIQGYLLRNVSNIDLSLEEQFRVLKSGGKMVSLDTTPPQKNLLLPFIQFYLSHIIPLLGKWVAGDQLAYQYLQESTRGFYPAEVLARRMVSAGFKSARFVRRLFSTMAIHIAEKG